MRIKYLPPRAAVSIKMCINHLPRWLANIYQFLAHLIQVFAQPNPVNEAQGRARGSSVRGVRVRHTRTQTHTHTSAHVCLPDWMREEMAELRASTRSPLRSNRHGGVCGQDVSASVSTHWGLSITRPHCRILYLDYLD